MSEIIDASKRRTVVNAIILNGEGEILLTKKGDKHSSSGETIWILPGGKMDEGETEIVTLNREISEELNGAQLDQKTIVKYKDFSGGTPFSGKQVDVKTYFAKLIGGTISNSAEILEAKFKNDFLSSKLSPITKEIIETLIADGYIKKPFEEITKVILNCLKNNQEFLYHCGLNSKKEIKITVENLANLAGNNLFDDHPELFNISKIEGHIFREFFQSNAGKKRILEIRKLFPDFFDEENDEFIGGLKE